MKIRTFVGRPHVAASTVMAALATAAMLAGAQAQQRAPAELNVGSNDLGGIVRSAKGPEAGVWVIAGTIDAATRHTKIVVTDDRGRYLIPDLPKGNYQVWVRGYGLIDSAKIQASPGGTFNPTSPNADIHPTKLGYGVMAGVVATDFFTH